VKRLITKNHRGIALIVALGSMILILIVAAISMYVITRGLAIASGQRTYQSAFEACEGGIELGLAEVNRAFLARTDPDTANLNIHKFKVRVLPDPLFSMHAEGSVLKFSRGYYGVGYGMSKGGTNFYYRILAESEGAGGERVTLEVQQKKRIM
jgi:Tfp pilus assembly protein PilX